MTNTPRQPASQPGPVPRSRCRLGRIAGAACMGTALLCGPLQAQEVIRERPQAQTVEQAVPPPASPMQSVIERAMGLLGIPYRWGGSSPEAGFDCSGLVRFVFREALGVQLPGRSDEIGKYGEKLAIGNLQPGDLVFFNTMRKSMSHVGIYLGDGKFLHAPSTGGFVRVEKMDLPYWVKRYEGARRMLSESWQAITLPGVLPARLHGAETLEGERNAPLAGEVRIDADAALTLPSSVPPGMAAAPRAQARVKDSGAQRADPVRAADPLDQLIRKLGQKP